MNNKGFIRLAWATLVVIFLVIIAGSFVRMSGSGMGCPDWPKCFGYFIPPSKSEQVHFQPNHQYKKGQMIIVDNDLMKANQNFTSTEVYNADNWQIHEKHDYAIFNPAHTWIEYINRLFGMLSGFFMLGLLIYSIILARQGNLSWSIVLLSFLGVILLGFQAWLGRTVVDSNLEGSKITAHMFGAIALIAVMLLIIRFSIKPYQFKISKVVLTWSWIALVVLLLQVFSGTTFRELVDHYLPEGKFQELFSSSVFVIHRSFSWVVLISIGILSYFAKKNKDWSTAFSLTILFVVMEFLLGVVLYKFEFPKFAQPLHLLGSNLLFASLFWICLAKVKK